MDNSKIIHTAGNLDTLARVGSGICKAAAIVCLVIGVLVGILSEKMLTSTAMSLDLDFLKLHLTDAYCTFTPMTKLYMVVGLISAAVSCWMFGFGLSLVRKVLDPMKQGRPFEDHTPGVLRKIAWVVIIGGVLTQLLGMAARVLSMQVFPMDEIFSSPAIDHVETMFNLDLSCVILGCVILFLSYVFQYGRTLQVEADETL